MYTRNLVPLDGSVPAEAVINLALVWQFLELSVSSSLVDGPEGKAFRHPPCQVKIQQQ
jgi:hypothetical protein